MLKNKMIISLPSVNGACGGLGGVAVPHVDLQEAGPQIYPDLHYDDDGKDF